MKTDQDANTDSRCDPPPSVERVTINADDDDGADAAPEVSQFRMMLPQVIACSVKNLLLIDLGLAVGFSTIVIPVLSGLQADRNPNETLRFDAVQMSWFGSMVFLTQPIGAIASGWITEAIGRKRAMLLVNVPHITAWLMFYFASSLTDMFVANVLLGLGIGLMESPILTYVGEISHPSIRGILLAFSHVTVIFGTFLMFVIGSLTTWRVAAALCCICPCITVVALMFIPETPHWLLTHNRAADAMASLQWLRGWVSPQAVRREYSDLIGYVVTANACLPCQRSGEPCTHRTGCLTKAGELLGGNVLRPFSVVMLGFIVVQSNGIVAVKPFLVQVFKLFGVPMDPNWASVVVGMMDVLANLTCMVAIKRLGKRVMCLTAVCLSGMCCFVLSINAYLNIPSGANSFHMEAFGHPRHDNYTALVAFVCLSFCGGVSHSVAWMYVSEVFPVRVRGLASGFSAATGYFVVFVATKTYYSLEMACSLWGAFLIYGCLTTVGLVLELYILPDTEGHTLEEIELYFSDSSRKFYDTRIIRTQNAGVGVEQGAKMRRRAPDISDDSPVERSNNELPTMRFDNHAFA